MSFVILPQSAPGTELELTSCYREPVIKCPVASNIEVVSAAGCELDYSNAASGYVMVKYTGCCEYAYVKIIQEELENTFKIFCSDDYTTLPLVGGSSSYSISFFEPEPSAGEYVCVKVLESDLIVKLDDEYSPYLYPNQMVWFTEESSAIQYSGELLDPSMSDSEVVAAIYRYTVETIAVDYELIRQIRSGAVSERSVLDVDSIYLEQSGVCLDYAVLMTAMLRSQQIPTKLIVGYIDTGWHSWVSVYTEEEGWVLYDPGTAAAIKRSNLLNSYFWRYSDSLNFTYEAVHIY